MINITMGGEYALRCPPILTPPPMTRQVIGKKFFFAPSPLDVLSGESTFEYVDSDSTSEGRIVVVGDGIAGSI